MKKIFSIFLAVLLVVSMSLTSFAAGKTLYDLYPDFSKVSPAPIVNVVGDGTFVVKEYGQGPDGGYYTLGIHENDKCQYDDGSPRPYKEGSWVEIVKEDGIPKYIRHPNTDPANTKPETPATSEKPTTLLGGGYSWFPIKTAKANTCVVISAKIAKIDATNSKITVSFNGEVSKTISVPSTAGLAVNNQVNISIVYRANPNDTSKLIEELYLIVNNIKK